VANLGFDWETIWGYLKQVKFWLWFSLGALPIVLFHFLTFPNELALIGLLVIFLLIQAISNRPRTGHGRAKISFGVGAFVASWSMWLFLGYTYTPQTPPLPSEYSLGIAAYALAGLLSTLTWAQAIGSTDDQDFF
jgi:hypothetical protein